MGTTFHNYHIHTENVGAVQEALEQVSGIAWISANPIHGWVSVYPYRVALAELAQALRVPAIELDIYDNDIASYQLYEEGVLVDEYNSAPDYWPEHDENGEELFKTPEQLAYYAPSPEKLLPYCLPQFSLGDVESAFRISRLDALKRAEQWARANYPAYQGSPRIPNIPGLELPDAYSVLMELFRLLGLETRSLYSGHGLVEEEDFPLILVGEELLTNEDLNKLLEQSVPDARIIPTSGEALCGATKKKLALMRKWLDRGANPDGNSYAGGYPVMTPLMHAAHVGCLEAVEILLEAGADVNYSYSYSGHTFSALALTKMRPGSESIITLLKSYGAEESHI